MQRKNARLPRLTLVLSSVCLYMQGFASVSAELPEKGRLVEGIYTSPSGELKCDLGKYISSPGFFINEAYEAGESETLSFGMDAGAYFELWIVRRQQAGRTEFTPLVQEGFTVNRDSFIPYFYSELPYEIKSIETMDGPPGRSEVLQVRISNEAQLHAYWLAEDEGWLNSIQFLPTLVESEEDVLSLTAVKNALSKLQERCTFENKGR